MIGSTAEDIAPAGWLAGAPETTGSSGATEDRVLSWLQGGEQAEDVTMEPLVITVSKQRRAALLRRAGWVEVNFQFIVRDFNNELLNNHQCFVQFTGPAGESNTDGVRVSAGIASYAGYWVKPNGVLRFLAVPLAGTPAEGGPVLEGALPVPARIPGNYGVFAARQEFDEGQLTAGNQEQVIEQLQVNGNAKVSILKVVEIGGGVTRTTGGTQTQTRQLSFTYRISRNTFAITPAPR